MLAAAAALRVVVMLGYPPVMWFNDSYRYVSDAIHLATNPSRPSGYPFFLRLLLPFHSFTLVAALQHLMGLAIGTGIYVLLRRRWLPAWGATLAAVPVLFDAYQMQIEQQVMSDALFMLLVTGAVVLLCWDDRVSVPVAVIAGAGDRLCDGGAVGGIAAPGGGGRLPAGPAGGLAPAGRPGRGGRDSHRGLHVRLLSAARTGRDRRLGRDVLVRPRAELRQLRRHEAACVAGPAVRSSAARPAANRGGIHLEPIRPAVAVPQGTVRPQVNALAQRFAVRAIEDQPLSYLRVVAADTWRAFGWNHDVNYDRQTNVLYLFSDPPPQIPSWADWKALRTFQPGLGQTRAVQPFAGFLGAYQRQVYLHGTLLGLMLLAGLGGLAARWRRWGGLVLLPWAVAVVLLVLPMATSGFSYRYTLAVIPLASIAAGLAFARRDGSREQDRRGRRRGDGAAGGSRADPEGSDRGERAASPITRTGDVRYGGSAGGGANT